MPAADSPTLETLPPPLPEHGPGGLVCCYVLDGQGGGRPLDWEGLRAWKPGDGLLWVHLDHEGEEARKWLREESGIDPVIVGSLLTHDIRPRSLASGDDLLVFLRGVNMNPGADPEDMVGVRLWLEPGRIVTLRRRRLMAVADMRRAIEAGKGPADVGGFLVRMADTMIARMGPVIDGLEDEVDALEDEILTGRERELRTRLGILRRKAIALRRYLAPQRDVMARLQSETVPWLEPVHRSQLREIADRTLRYVEDLDSARERAAVTQDEFDSRLSDEMNKTVYLLTVISAVLLPPSLLTGLLGINVGGLPMTESPLGFTVVVIAILGLGALEILLLRRLKWL